MGGWLSPNSIPTTLISRRIRIPDDPLIIAAVNGAIRELANSWEWQQFGTVTPDDIAVAMNDLYLEYEESTGMSFVGMVFGYVSVTPPPNCLFCNGATYLKVDYPELAALLAGSALDLNSTQFKVPTLDNGRFPRGASLQTNIGNVAGANTVTLTNANLPAHSHTVGNQGAPIVVAPGALPVATPSIAAVTGNTGTGTAVNIVPLHNQIAFHIVAR